MKKFLNPLLGLLFLALSGAVIFSSNLAVRFFPAQEVDLRGGFEFGRLLKGYLFVQEVTAAKDWLTAVDLGLAALGGGAPCENTLQVLDSGGQVLYTERFTSANISRMKYRTFVFPKKLHVGRGNKVTLCLSSANGSMDSSLVLPRKADGKLGKLSARPVINDDAAAALKGTGPVIRMEGSLCARTYESNWGSVNWLKTFLFFAAFLAASFIALADRLKPVMAGLRFAPEKIYVVLALVFGLALAFITPPLQTPDENKHLNRSYQLSEFNIFQFDTSVPASLLRLSETFKRLNFDPLGKTSPGEIFSQRRVALDPASRSRDEIAVPTFIFPYFPQALGIFTGRLFNASPITLLYAGRIFNLLFSIALVYFAIRTAPFFKWVFFLLGLMPMTLYLSASLAKDAMIFSLSFLLIAFFLRFSYGGGKELRAKELAVLFVLSFLTAASRPIYLVLAGLFLLIPVCRLGSFKRYTLVFACLLLTTFLGTQVWSLKPLFRPARAAAASVQPPAAPPPVTKQPDQTIAPAGSDSHAQKKFILNNPVRYLGIMFKTVFIYLRTSYLDSFVGILGWMIRPLPAWHIDLYLWFLLATALLSSGYGIRTGVKGRLIPACLLAAGVAIVETAMYLDWTPVGQNYVNGVQGRYFIPYAPLFFLMFYNRTADNFLRRFFAAGGSKTVKSKRKALINPAEEAGDNRPPVLYNFGYLLLVCFSVVSLLSTVYVVLSNYYIVLLGSSGVVVS